VEREASGGFLPPEPPGPEPELGSGPPSRQPPQAPPPGHGWQQQPQTYPSGPGYGQPPPWGYSPAAREPDNGPAIAGFVLSLVAGALLVLSAGLSSVISVGCAVAGMIYSRKGKRKVEAGETTKNSGLAQAGFIISIVTLVLSALATAFWVLILVLALVDEDVRRDLENEFDDSQTIRASHQAIAAVVRVGGHLLS
jgi:hypothetical protein